MYLLDILFFILKGYNEKLICVDVDGTILDHNGYLNPEVFERFKKSEHKIIIASGRQVKQIRDFGFDCDYVGSNGAEVIKDGTLLMRKVLPSALVGEMFELADVSYAMGRN